MLNSIFVIIGTIIGAGFASGREILTFFNVYNWYGFLGLIISEIIIGFVIYKSFRIIINYNINTYPQFIDKIIGKSGFINTVFCNIINIFLLISFIIMVAGFSAYFSQEFNIPYIFGATLIAVLSFFTFLKSIDGIIKINSFFIPFLIFIILLLGIKNFNCFSSLDTLTIEHNFNWFISALLYASYNLIIVFPILIGLKKCISNFKQAKTISICVTFILILLAIILFFLIEFYFTEVYNLELPTIFIATQSGNFYKYVCGFVILGAIFTTAISSGYGFLRNFNSLSKKHYTFLAFSICLLSIALSNIGFSTLLSLLYPILGILRSVSNHIYHQTLKWIQLLFSLKELIALYS